MELVTRRVATTTLPALVVVGALGVATVLAALVVTRGDLVEADGQATTYLLTGTAEVPRGLTQDDVVVVRGTATVNGTVEDDVIVLDGRVRVRGTVNGDVVVVRGGARIDEGAVVGGDVRTSRPARIAEGVTVNGDVRRVSTLDAARSIPRTLYAGMLLAAGLAVLLVGLLAPRPAATAARNGVGRPGRAFVLGLLALGLVPLAAGLFAVSLLGIGVGLVLGGGLLVAVAVGSAATATALGRLVGLPDGRGAFVAGWLAVGLTLGLALLASPVLAALAALAVAAFGIGALVPTRRPVDEAVSPPTDDPDDRDDRDDRDDSDDLGGTGWAGSPSTGPGLGGEDDGPRILASFPIGSGSSRN